ncbi:hypothetical protein MC885_000955 [Smutsia gigantea]|nr:hypothetical protein MC885_000955 [Smutsia gigantea]
MSSSSAVVVSPAVPREGHYLGPQTLWLMWGAQKSQKKSFWKVRPTTSLNTTVTPSATKWHSS